MGFKSLLPKRATNDVVGRVKPVTTPMPMDESKQAAGSEGSMKTGTPKSNGLGKFGRK
jgi:hypothetical protein